MLLNSYKENETLKSGKWCMVEVLGRGIKWLGYNRKHLSLPELKYYCCLSYFLIRFEKGQCTEMVMEAVISAWWPT